MVKKYKGFINILLYFAIFAYLFLAIVTPIVNRRLSPSRAFRKFVCRPIPKSVKEIKMDRRVSWHGRHRFVFHFKIDEADLSPILNVQHSMFVPRPFEELQYFKYNPEYGGIEWAKELIHEEGMPPIPQMSFGIVLYEIRSGQTEPEWFNLGQWDNPKAYVYAVGFDRWNKDEYRLRFLVYNKELGEAYFIDYRSPD